MKCKIKKLTLNDLASWIDSNFEREYTDRNLIYSAQWIVNFCEESDGKYECSWSIYRISKGHTRSKRTQTFIDNHEKTKAAK